MDSLKKSSDEKEKLLQHIKSGDIKDEVSEEKSTDSEEPNDEKAELSEWEKRLEGMADGAADDANAEKPKEEGPKKKGLFGRGKK